MIKLSLLRHLCYLIIITNLTNAYGEVKSTAPKCVENKKRLIKILSIDGGGIRGIIPAYIIADLEKRLPPGKGIGEYFDIIAGTSSGGITALMLTTPNNEGKPKYNAAHLLENFLHFSKETLKVPLWRKIITGNGLWHVKYSEENLQRELHKCFGELKLSQTLTNVIIPTYEIERDKTFFFKTARAQKELSQDCFMKDLAYATSAAPTYFPPARLKDVANKRTLTLVDGGVAADNPSLAAAIHALEIYGKDIELFVLSLGTGTTYGDNRKNIKYQDIKDSGMFGWRSKIIPLMMYSANAVTDYQMGYFLNTKDQYYFRMQTFLNEEDAIIDNISEKNLNALKNYAKNLIKDNQEALDCIAQVLYKKDFLPSSCKKHNQSYEYLP